MLNFDDRLQYRQVGQTLSDMPLGSIIEKLAMSIADAQRALDMQAIQTFSEMAATKMMVPTPAGPVQKSMLELGFAPSFYHFDTVVIEIKVEIKLHVEEQQSVRIGSQPGAESARATSGTPTNTRTDDKRPSATNTPNTADRTSNTVTSNATADNTNSNKIATAPGAVTQTPEQAAKSKAAAEALKEMDNKATTATDADKEAAVAALKAKSSAQPGPRKKLDLAGQLGKPPGQT